MPLIILLALLLILIYAPQWWARRTFKRYAKPQAHISGTGGELAKHLLERFKMHEVAVETTEEGGDHYDLLVRPYRFWSLAISTGKLNCNCEPGSWGWRKKLKKWVPSL